MKTAWHVPALRGVLGDWVFYPALMSAEQIAQRVIPSKDIREAEGLEDHLQRNLKPRVDKIIRYLKKRNSRFFNAILLGVFDALPDWVDFKLASVGEKLGLPDVSVAESSIGLLIFKGTEKIFAIDGQHRAEAIGRAHKKSAEAVQADQFPVIFLAHVDDKPGKVRTRRLFCDINNNAVKLSDGDKVIIDEDDLCAVVARRIYAEYPAFRAGREIAVTEKKEQMVQDGKEKFTSLLAIWTVCKKLRRLFKKERGTAEIAPENIQALQKIATDFFDYAIQHEQSLNKYFKQHKTKPANERKENRNLCFRPIGLELLARLYVHFHSRQKLAVLDWALKHLKWENPGGVWDGTVWSNGKIQPKGKSAAVNYALYLLHELPDASKTALRDNLRELTKNEDYELPPRVDVPVKLRARP